MSPQGLPSSSFCLSPLRFSGCRNRAGMLVPSSSASWRQCSPHSRMPQGSGAPTSKPWGHPRAVPHLRREDSEPKAVGTPGFRAPGRSTAPQGADNPGVRIVPRDLSRCHRGSFGSNCRNLPIRVGRSRAYPDVPLTPGVGCCFHTMGILGRAPTQSEGQGRVASHSLYGSDAPTIGKPVLDRRAWRLRPA